MRPHQLRWGLIDRPPGPPRPPAPPKLRAQPAPPGPRPPGLVSSWETGLVRGQGPIHPGAGAESGPLDGRAGGRSQWCLTGTRRDRPAEEDPTSPVRMNYQCYDHNTHTHARAIHLCDCACSHTRVHLCVSTHVGAWAHECTLVGARLRVCVCVCLRWDWGHPTQPGGVKEFNPGAAGRVLGGADKRWVAGPAGSGLVWFMGPHLAGP